MDVEENILQKVMDMVLSQERTKGVTKGVGWVVLQAPFNFAREKSLDEKEQSAPRGKEGKSGLRAKKELRASTKHREAQVIQMWP